MTRTRGDFAFPWSHLGYVFGNYLELLQALSIIGIFGYTTLIVASNMLVANAPELGNNYAAFTQNAVDSVFKGFGSQFVSIAMIFFVYSTIMAYYFYSESSIIYLFRGRYPKREKLVIRILQAVMLAAVVYGAVREADVVWQLGDIGVGLMAWFTVIGIILLYPKAIKALKEYESNH